MEGIDIMLAVDVSTSMLAQDFKPNRVEALKEIAKKFIDKRPIVDVTKITYENAVLFAAIALLLFAVASAAYLFIDDYIEVKASKGAKRTIMQRVIGFLRDYKSEVKKIVWPGLRDVAKNTLIVLIISAMVGVFIWLLDWGLGSLVGFISKLV